MRIHASTATLALGTAYIPKNKKPIIDDTTSHYTELHGKYPAGWKLGIDDLMHNSCGFCWKALCLPVLHHLLILRFLTSPKRATAWLYICCVSHGIYCMHILLTLGAYTLDTVVNADHMNKCSTYSILQNFCPVHLHTPACTSSWFKQQ